MSITMTAPPSAEPEHGAREGWTLKLGRVRPPHLLAVTLVLACGVLALAPPSDPDVWWHVRTGELILEDRRLPGVDPWSAVAAGREWVTHEWLSQVIIAVFYKMFGLTGLSLYRSLGVTALVALLAVQAFRRTTPYRALICTLLACFATMGGWGERPQLLSFLLLVGVAQLIRSCAAGRRSPWWLVPIIWLWANLHGLWVLAIALLGVAVLGLLLQQAWRQNLDRAARLTTVAVLSLAAAASTPNGPRLLLAPLHVRDYAQFVSEWGAPSIQTAYGLAFFGIVISLIVLYGSTNRRMSSYTLVQVAFAVLLGTLYIRTVAPAAVLLIPLLADAFGERVPTVTEKRSLQVVNGVFLGTILMGTLVGAALTLMTLPRLPPAAPVAATEALVNSGKAPLRVVNEYGIGGWLLHRAPTVQPAIDGRTEIYPVDYVADYLNSLKMSGDWKSTIADLDPDVALLHPATPLVNGLRDELGWLTVYSDKNWLVLKPGGAEATGVGGP